MDESSKSQRLDSWKEIAVYLGRGVTTVQRWERTEGLPVHRLPHAKKGSVFAFANELDAWRTARSRQPAADELGAPTVPAVERDRHPATIAIAAGAFLLLAAATALTFGRARPARTPASSSSTAVAARPLANDSSPETSPSLSPDGERVAYSWRGIGSPGLYIKSVGGGPPRYLASIAGIGLCWAPDGRSIAFADRHLFDSDLRRRRRWVRSARLTWEESKEEYPAWSRDGRWIYFSSDRAGVSQIWTVPADGGVALPVTSTQASQAFESADGATLYFTGSVLWTQLDRYDSDIMVIDAWQP